MYPLPDLRTQTLWPQDPWSAADWYTRLSSRVMKTGASKPEEFEGNPKGSSRL